MDVRIRLFLGRELKNFHVLLIPFSDSQTGLKMFEAIKSLLVAIDGEYWSFKLLSAAIHGTNNTVDFHSTECVLTSSLRHGAVTRLEGVVLEGFYRV